MLDTSIPYKNTYKRIGERGKKNDVAATTVSLLSFYTAQQKTVLKINSHTLKGTQHEMHLQPNELKTTTKRQTKLCVF